MEDMQAIESGSGAQQPLSNAEIAKLATIVQGGGLFDMHADPTLLAEPASISHAVRLVLINLLLVTLYEAETICTTVGSRLPSSRTEVDFMRAHDHARALSMLALQLKTPVHPPEVATSEPSPVRPTKHSAKGRVPLDQRIRRAHRHT